MFRSARPQREARKPGNRRHHCAPTSGIGRCYDAAPMDFRHVTPSSLQAGTPGGRTPRALTRGRNPRPAGRSRRSRRGPAPMLVKAASRLRVTAKPLDAVDGGRGDDDVVLMLSLCSHTRPRCAEDRGGTGTMAVTQTRGRHRWSGHVRHAGSLWHRPKGCRQPPRYGLMPRR